jgi:hypothetical protein
MKTRFKTIKVNTLYRLCVALVVAGPITTAHAVLGGDITSVDTDRVQLSAKSAVRLVPSATASYTVHEITLPSGTLVRQYVSGSEGIVFAVAWSGPFIPDLRQLMGSHFDKMLEREAGKAMAGQRHIAQRYSDLVVESSGHPRSFTGRAYLPAALPAGMALEAIQ